MVRAGGRALRSYRLESVGGPGGRRGRLAGLVAQAGAVPAPPTPPRPPRDRASRTPSCTATPTSASWTVRAIPEELVEQAARLGLEALALTDHDGMYGVVRFAEAAAELGIRTVFGAELSLGLTAPQNGVADPEGSHLLLLARDPDGYRGLCRTISTAQLAGQEKGRPVYDLEEVVADTAGHVLVLTGCRKGAVRQALERGRPCRGGRRAPRPGRAVRVGQRRRRALLRGAAHGHRGQRRPGRPRRRRRAAHGRQHRRALRHAGAVPAGHGAGGGAGPAQPGRGRRLAAARGHRAPARRARRWRPGSTPAIPGRWRGRRSSARSARSRSTWSPRTCRRSRPRRAARRRSGCASSPAAGCCERYGSYAEYPEAVATVERELAVIEARNFPGYFLIVHDIVAFCRASGILCQGRGSAANSAVCYALGITNVDAVAHGLLFERFLSPARDGYPDIDLDIESGRREEVIQYVYSRYGRDRAAQVANVISYRPRSAVRDVAKALGFSPGQQDAWSKQIERWHGTEGGEIAGHARAGRGAGERAPRLPPPPRHPLRRHGHLRPPGGGGGAGRVGPDGRPHGRAVGQGRLRGGRAGEVRPARAGHAHRAAPDDRPRRGAPRPPRRAARAAAGRSRGLRDARAGRLGRGVPGRVPGADGHAAPAAPAEVLRPGRRGRADPARAHPGRLGAPLHPAAQQAGGVGATTTRCWRTPCDKTLGVPLFQEQLMQVAVDVAGFSPADADELRRAMGSKRSTERMERLRGRFYAGMAANGIEGALADKIFDRMLAFANFGFPESHSISFASLVYYSAWFKLYHPSAFCAALLNAQPMGFYSPQSLVADARRHGVRVRGPDVNLGGARAVLQPDAHSAGGQAVRLGMAEIRTIGEKLAEQIEAERARDGPYRDLADLARRVRLTVPQAEALATAGALGSFGVDRRAALWAAGVVAAVRPEQLPGTAVGLDAPALPGMTAAELTVADVWATGVSPDSHPIVHLRERLDRFGALAIDRLDAVGLRRRPGRPAPGAGRRPGHPPAAARPPRAGSRSSTWKTRPACSTSPARRGCGCRYRTVALGSAALLVRGRLERSEEGVLNLVADRLARLVLAVPVKSRDFR